MAVKMWGVAMVAAMLTASGAQAQLGGPANLPPRGFSGQQFVDNRGCLFLRAGSGAAVNWVARIDRNRKPICGMPPTGGAAVQAALAADMAPDPLAAPQVQVAATPVVVPTVQANAPAAPQATNTQQGGGFNLAQLFGTGGTGAKPSPAPAPTVFVSAKAPAVQAQAPVQTAPTYAAIGVATSVEGVQCYPETPRLERVKVSGGTSLVCTKGDGSLTGWRPPMVANARQAQIAAQTAPLIAMPAATTPMVMAAPVQTTQVQVAVVQAPIVPVPMVPVPVVPVPVAQVYVPPVQVVVPVVQPVVRSRSLPKPPKGWAYAWKDDRLNPLRGVGTAQGQAQQDQVWARTVPMVLVTDPPPRSTVAQVLGLHTTVSTMSAAVQKPVSQKAAPVTQQASAAPQGQPELMVQVGCFGEPANAQGTANRLTTLGLPVSTATTTRKGKALQIVYAGPFSTTAEAQAGLATLRAAGFADAFLR